MFLASFLKPNFRCLSGQDDYMITASGTKVVCEPAVSFM